jgi:hypothetical protein
LGWVRVLGNVFAYDAFLTKQSGKFWKFLFLECTFDYFYFFLNAKFLTLKMKKIGPRVSIIFQMDNPTSTFSQFKIQD